MAVTTYLRGGAGTYGAVIAAIIVCLLLDSTHIMTWYSSGTCPTVTTTQTEVDTLLSDVKEHIISRQFPKMNANICRVEIKNNQGNRPLADLCERLNLKSALSSIDDLLPLPFVLGFHMLVYHARSIRALPSVLNHFGILAGVLLGHHFLLGLNAMEREPRLDSLIRIFGPAVFGPQGPPHTAFLASWRSILAKGPASNLQLLNTRALIK